MVSCHTAGEDLSADRTITTAGITACAASAATCAACATVGGTWGLKSVTPGVLHATDRVCLNAKGVLFGTVAPTAGYAQNGISHDCVCEYDDNRCWEIDYPTKEVMYRCIPCEDPSQADCVPLAQKETKCTLGNSGTLAPIDETSCGLAAQKWCTGDSKCCSVDCVNDACPAASITLSYPVPGDVTCAAGTYKYLLTTVETQSQPDNAIGDAVSGGFATVMAYISDLFSCKWVIVTCGACIAMCVSWFWVFLLKVFVKPLVWITIVSVLAGLAILTWVGLCKSGQLSTAEELIEAYASVGGSSVSAFGITLAPEGEAWIWALMWIFGGIAFFVAFILLLMKQKKIRQATAVIKEASNALADMPLMIFFPFLPLIICLLFFTYFMMGAAFIWTADQISMDDMTAAVAEASNITAPVSSSEDVLFYMFWYHLLGFLWANQLVQAISMTAISGAYSYWYFYGRDEEKKGQVPHAFLKSLKRVLRYHIGSMAFGALIVALVQLARAILAYVDSQTKTWQDKSKVLKIAFKVVACCLWCFEKLVKFVTRNAYIFIAINGKAFCTSAKHAFWTIIKNLFLVGFVNLVSVILILLGKLIIMVGCGVVAYIYIEGSGDFTYIEKEAVTCINPATGDLIDSCDKVVLLKSPVVPVIFTMLLAYTIASMFFYTYQLGVDTLLMCFIEEKTILDAATKNGKAVEFSGPDALVKFMEASGKGAKKGKEKAEDKKADARDDDVKVSDAPARRCPAPLLVDLGLN